MKTAEAPSDDSCLLDLNSTPPAPDSVLTMNSKDPLHWFSFQMEPGEAIVKPSEIKDYCSVYYDENLFVKPVVTDFWKNICKDDSGTSKSCVVNASTKCLESEASSSTRPVLYNSSPSINKIFSLSLDKPGFKTYITRQFFPPKSPLDSVIPSVSAFSETQFSGAFWSDARLKLPPPPPPPPQQVNKSRRGPRSRSSPYRGVTFYKRTGRWESHIWDCGKQVYLGGFDTAHMAARAYDKVAIKFRGAEADINFNLSDYDEDIKQMKNLTKEEFVHILRQQSTGFSRESSKYRGVSRLKASLWEARVGNILGKKAYDRAAINYNGKDAVTNIYPSLYSNEFHATKNGSVEQNLDLSLVLSSPIVGGTFVPEDNNKKPLFKIESRRNTLTESDRKKSCYMNPTGQVGSPDSEEFQVKYALPYKALCLIPIAKDDNVHLTMEEVDQ